jgi:hypothetical protein
VLLLAMAGCRLGVDYGDSSFGGDVGGDSPDAADATSSPYAAAVLADGPVLYLPFDEDDGPVALDASGGGRDGTLAGGAERSTEVAFDDAGRAMWFDGDDDRVTVPDDEAVRLNGDFSIEMWHRVDGDQAGDYPGLLKKGSAVMTGYMIYFKSFQTPLATMKRSGIDQIEAADRPLDGAYHHLVFTYRAEDTTLCWYVDGELVFTRDDLAFATNVDESVLTIGAADNPGRQLIDELALYPAALSAARVAAHHALAIE